MRDIPKLQFIITPFIIVKENQKALKIHFLLPRYFHNYMPAPVFFWGLDLYKQSIFGFFIADC